MKLKVATKIEFIINIVAYIMLFPVAIIGLVFQKVADAMTWVILKSNGFKFAIGNRLLKCCPDIPYQIKNSYTAMGYTKELKYMSRGRKRKLRRELKCQHSKLISHESRRK